MTDILTNDAISTDATFAGATNTAVPSQLAVKTYADTKQTAYANLTAIGALANAAGILQNNGAGVFTYAVAGTGTVTSVAALTLGTAGTDLSSTVATGTTTPVITLQVPTASAANRGALSAADWTTFNGKQAALGFTPINKAGDTGIGALSIGALTATTGAFSGAVTAGYATSFIGGDANSIRGNGNYAGYSVTNGPYTSGDWFSIEARSNPNGDILSQICYDHYQRQAMWTRYSANYGTTWSSWNRVVDALFLANTGLPIGGTTGTFSSSVSMGSLTAGAAGFNGNAAQAKVTVNAASTDLATVIALCNQLRAALVANGICV